MNETNTNKSSISNPLSLDQQAEIKRLWREGELHKAGLVERYGVSAVVVRELTRGIKPVRRAKTDGRVLLRGNGATKGRVIAALKANPESSVSEIAKIARCTPSYIYKVIGDLRKEGSDLATAVKHRKPRNGVTTDEPTDTAQADAESESQGGLFGDVN